MWEALLDALLDTLKIVPWLLIAHVLIEVFEYHAASKIKVNRLLRGGFAPLIGSAAGLLPQCGFSVVATDLYAQRRIRIGTLLAVFIATSDEAIPIMLSGGTDGILRLIPLLVIKFAFAVVVGYAVNAITLRRGVIRLDEGGDAVLKGCHGHEIGEHTHSEQEGEGHRHGQEKSPQKETAAQLSAEHADDIAALEADGGSDKQTAGEGAEGCVLTGKKKKFDFKCFVVHPLIHTLTVTAYILVVNVAFGLVIWGIGEAQLERFLRSVHYAQPLLAGLIGLIPNCASSVVIAQMYSAGHLCLGAAVAGLSVNAGLGFAVLFKQNRPMSQNFAILGGLYVAAVAVGTLLSLLPY